jgi:hypothetical protein
MRFPSRTALLLLSAAWLAAPALADEIFLRGGGRVSGVIVERTPDAVSIETAPGRVTLSMRRVERIVGGRSALEEFRERAARLAARDAEGWAALARWATDRDLVTPSREAWRRVLAVDPAHPEANAALGRVDLDGTWVSEDEAYRARGYVEYEGRWVTPAEHEALLRERVAEEAALRESREAALRVREAEARAREAEARAREAGSVQEVPDGSIPLWWAMGGGVPLEPPYVDQPPHDGTVPPHEPPHHGGPPPAPSWPGSSIGPLPSGSHQAPGAVTSPEPPADQPAGGHSGHPGHSGQSVRD